MCTRCDYPRLLKDAGLAVTANRLRVLAAVGDRGRPLAAEEIFDLLGGEGCLNRVTVYRILNLLVDRGLLERLAGGGRAACYGLAPNEHHRPHPHFYCQGCGRVQCLAPGSLEIDADRLERTFRGRIDNVQVRVEGLCRDCVQAPAALPMDPRAAGPAPAGRSAP